MISVCLTTYNGAAYIEPQLNSILCQLTEGDEIVVSDDASSDDTLLVVSRVMQRAPQGICMRIVHNEGEHGYTANFENALRQAKGDYIFLSDQDDVWLPGKVACMVKALEADKRHLLAVCNARITDSQLNVTADDYYKARGVYQGLLGNLYKFGYLGCCMAMRRELLHTALPFPKNRSYCVHDNWLFLCAQIHHRGVVIISKPLMLYRRHSATCTTGAKNAHKPTSFRIRYRLYLVGQLISRLVTHTPVSPATSEQHSI